MHGEAEDADMEGVRIARRALPKLLEDYDLRDIFNLDETGLYYRRLPLKSLMRKKRKGKKLAKDRFSLNFIVNALGSEAYVQCIGTAKRPRSFGRTFDPLRDLGIFYANNKTAWMRSDIFEQVLRWFHHHVCCFKPKRKILLLMDNCKAYVIPKHGRPLDFGGGIQGFSYLNVTVVFFPANVTSIIQPLDQGIIAAFKAHYQRMHCSWILQELEGEKSLSDLRINAYQALLWIRDAKKEIMGETIRNCWTKVKILPPTLDADLHNLRERKVRVSAPDLKQAYDDLADMLKKLKLEESVNDILSPALEDLTLIEEENPPEEEIEQEESEDDNDEIEAEQEIKLLTLKEAKTAASELHYFIMQNMDQKKVKNSEELINLMKKTVMAMHTTSAKTQKSLTDFFTVIKKNNVTKGNKEGERDTDK